MSEKTNYRLANIQKKELKLRSIRQEILTSESEKALELIFDAPAPASLIQSFPDQDLYYLMHKIGPDDFIPILALSKSQQWEYILDVEVWDNDRLDLDIMTKTFDILFQADPERLLRWVITEKPDFFEFYLFKNMIIYIREHDETPPSDFDDYITLDDKFYFRFPGRPKEIDPDVPAAKDNSSHWELIEKMLKTLAGMDLSVFHGLLLETHGVLPAETEEEQFRLRNLRLAEKGFLPTHEAIGIYQPTGLSALRKRPDSDALHQSSFDPDIPLPPQFFSNFIEKEDLFTAALNLCNPEFILHLQSELAALINKIISADKIKLRSKEDLEKAVKKACAYLNLGLEVLSSEGPGPEFAKKIIQEYFLEDIFRTGSRAGIRLKTKAAKWFKDSFINTAGLPLSFLGEEYLGVIGGLLIDYPLYFDNYVTNVMYRNFSSLSDVDKTSRSLKQIIAIDAVIGKLSVDLQSFKTGMLTYKTLILTLWAKNRLGQPSTLEPIDITLFKDFFAALFSTPDPGTNDRIQLDDIALWASETTGQDETNLPKAFDGVLANLMKEIEKEYKDVDPENIDARFIPHFLLINN